MTVPRFKSLAHFIRYKQQWVRASRYLVGAERDDLGQRLCRHESVAFALKNKKKCCFDLQKHGNDTCYLRAAPREKDWGQQETEDTGLPVTT
jgi:hypothetical protein